MCRWVCNKNFLNDNNDWIFSRATLFTIYLGSANRSDPNIQTVAASEYILHPSYDPQTLDNDIGLIKLRMPVTFTGTNTNLI